MAARSSTSSRARRNTATAARASPACERAIPLPLEDDGTLEEPGYFRHRRNPEDARAARRRAVAGVTPPPRSGRVRDRPVRVDSEWPTLSGSAWTQASKCLVASAKRPLVSNARPIHRAPRRIGLLFEEHREKRTNSASSATTLVEQHAAKQSERREVSRAERERALEVSGGNNGIALHAFDVTEMVRPARFGRVRAQQLVEIGFGRSYRFRGHEELSDGPVLSGQCRWRSCRARSGKP